MEEESGFEISWRMFFSPKFLLGYIVCGLVWLTVTLPSLLEAADHKWWKAILIAIWRILVWPYQFGIAAYAFFKKDNKDDDNGQD